MKTTISEQSIHEKYHKQIFAALDQEPFAQFLGIKLQEVGEGSATAELVVKDHMLNSHGTIHGAILFSIADYVFAAASNSYGKTAVGLSTNVNFMAPGLKGSVITATAVEAKRTNRIAWYNIRVESNGELLATMEATAYRKNNYFVEIDELGDI